MNTDLTDRLKNFNILVVDDEPSITEIISEEFALLGAKVTTSMSGNKAFKILTDTSSKDKFDIVITDVRMPDGDGIELLKNINEKLYYKPLLFICSGFHRIGDEELKALNVIATFEKPFTIQDILEFLPPRKNN